MSNFREEFLVVYGHQGVHVVTLVPIAEIPYSDEGLPTMGVVQPLDGPHWLPARTGSLSPCQHLKTPPEPVGMVSDHFQSSGRGYFRGWFGSRPCLLLHDRDSGSPLTFHTKSLRMSFSQTSLVRYVCTRWLRLRGFFHCGIVRRKLT